VIISVCSLIGFIAREFTVEHPLVIWRVFKNRNFAVGVLLMLSLAAILYGTTAELPLFFADADGLPGIAKRLRA